MAAVPAWRSMVLAALCLSVPSICCAQGLDPTIYYRLNTEFRGPGLSLDVFNGGPRNDLTHLAPRQDVSGQYWRFTPAADGSYRITTMFRGSDMCLDVFNGGPRNNQPHLAPCANVSGQHWLVMADGPWFRLATRFRGRGMCLDIFNGGDDDNQPHLAPCGNYSGQHWVLTRTTKS